MASYLRFAARLVDSNGILEGPPQTVSWPALKASYVVGAYVTKAQTGFLRGRPDDRIDMPYIFFEIA